MIIQQRKYMLCEQALETASVFYYGQRRALLIVITEGDHISATNMASCICW